MNVAYFYTHDSFYFPLVATTITLWCVTHGWLRAVNHELELMHENTQLWSLITRGVRMIGPTEDHPYPGSDEARARGCTCAVLWEGCPVHDAPPQPVNGNGGT